jgi:hypothetical protein
VVGSVCRPVAATVAYPSRDREDAEDHEDHRGAEEHEEGNLIHERVVVGRPGRVPRVLINHETHQGNREGPKNPVAESMASHSDTSHVRSADAYSSRKRSRDLTGLPRDRRRGDRQARAAFEKTEKDPPARRARSQERIEGGSARASKVSAQKRFQLAYGSSGSQA